MDEDEMTRVGKILCHFWYDTEVTSLYSSIYFLQTEDYQDYILGYRDDIFRDAEDARGINDYLHKKFDIVNNRRRKRS